MDVIAAREFTTLYIIADLVWLVVFSGLLIYFKKYQTLLVGLLAGVLYLLIDYGIFYSLLGTRHIEGANPFWFLLWLSFSYGITNFAWFWILLDRDKYWIEWTVFITFGYLAVAQVGQTLGANFPQISIYRGTNAYHGVMAILGLIAYGIILYRNIKHKENGVERVNVLWLVAMGIGVQFSWEFALLVSGIRPPHVMPLIVNSLVETNFAPPYIYLIHRAVKKRWGS